MSLDSDVNNSYEKLNVEFYTNKIPGHVNEGKPYCRIITPGDQTNIVDQPVGERHKRNFPRQWLYFQMQNNDGDATIGIPLADWHKDRPQELSAHQMDELRILKFQVVEQVANASDRQLERVGMGGVGMRERARAYINHRGQSESAREMDALKKQLAEMQEKMAQMGSDSADKRGPGRPPKDRVNVNNDITTTGSAGNG